jgi:carboxypeptidase T
VQDKEFSVFPRASLAIGLVILSVLLANLPSGQYVPVANSAPGIPSCYRTVTQLYAAFQTYNATYPNLVELTDYGDSWDKATPGGPAGFDLWVMRITNEAIGGPKPRVFYDGGIHAREIATPELVMAFADRLLTGYGYDPDVTALVDYNEIYLVSTSNPDGHLMEELYSGYWRKNTDNDDGCPTGTYGVDLNRNHIFKWACCGGSSGVCSAEDYRGPSAGSEPEIQSYESFVRTLFPDQRGPGDNDPAPITTTGVLINYHSTAASFLYPWGWTTNASPNAPDLIAIGRKYASYNGYAVQSALYPVDGNTRDWAYGELGIAGFVVELGGSDFYASCAELPGLINENLQAAYYTTKLSEMPYLRIHGPETEAPVAVVYAGNTVTVTANVTFVWTGNPNSQNVGAAELYVDTPPIRGGTPITMTAVDGAFNSPTEQVRAVLDISSLPGGRHQLFVRGRGVNAYSGYPTWGPLTGAFVYSGVGTPTATPSPSPTVSPTATTCSPGNTGYGITTSTGATLTPGSTDVGNHCDDCVTAVALPFPVLLYGTTYSGNITVSSNGSLQFASSVSPFSNACLPDASHNDAIFGYWDDLRTDGTGRGIFTAVSGSAPNRTFIVEWRAVTYSGSQTTNFAIQLHEGSPSFEIVYGANPGGASATTGVQQGAGARYTQFSCNTSSLSQGLQLAFALVACGSPTPTGTPGPATATATATAVPPTATATATATPGAQFRLYLPLALRQ